MSFNFTSDMSDKLDGEIIQKLSNIFINNKLLDVIEFCSLDHCQISNLAASLCIDRKVSIKYCIISKCLPLTHILLFFSIADLKRNTD